MTLEVATYINDLQPVNPPGTDPTSQGDDHLRLIKQVLPNQFPGATRAWAVPSVSSFSTSPVTVTKPMDGSTLFISTTGGATVINLPTLVAGDAGWSVGLYKTTADVNPMFVTPPSGNVVSGGYTVTKARRCIPGVRIACIWTGTQFFVSRAGSAPISCMLDFYGTTLPAGYEWPSGQTLASVATNYPEYNAVVGSGLTPDMRGRAGLALDNLGGTAAGRLPNGFISGSVLGGVGGVDAAVITSAQMPSHQHAVFLHDPQHNHTLQITNSSTTGNDVRATGGNAIGGVLGSQTSSTQTTGVTIGSVNGVANDNQTAAVGSGAIRGNLQPSIMIGKILVVE